jgi:hypothetical protein
MDDQNRGRLSFYRREIIVTQPQNTIKIVHKVSPMTVAGVVVASAAIVFSAGVVNRFVNESLESIRRWNGERGQQK